MVKTSGQLERERRLKMSEILITDFTTCHYCKSTGLNEQDKYCPNCRFPQRGTQIEMKRFLFDVKKKNKLLSDKLKDVKKARNILFILAGLNVLAGIILGVLVNFDIAILIGSLIGAGIYFGLGMWSKNKPFAAILSGFFVYVVFNVISAIDDPQTIYQGVIWKVIIISGFIYGYKGVKDAENLEKELKAMKESKDLTESSGV
jgi:hypothetical protein